MATSKILIDGVGIDLTGDTVQASKLEQGYTAHNSNGEQITGTLVPGTQPNIQPNKPATPSASQQVIRPDSGYDALEQVTISAVPTGTAGTPTATKGAVSNHSVTVTPGVTNVTGYITGGTETGTPVTVSASELVSGSETKTQNGTYDVTNLAQLVVNVSGGAAAQIETGSFLGTGIGSRTISVSFVPDIVIVQGPDAYSEEGIQMRNPMVFYTSGLLANELVSALTAIGEFYDASTYKQTGGYMTLTSSGFSIESIYEDDLNGNTTYPTTKTYTFTAIKYTA